MNPLILQFSSSAESPRPQLHLRRLWHGLQRGHVRPRRLLPRATGAVTLKTANFGRVFESKNNLEHGVAISSAEMGERAHWCLVRAFGERLRAGTAAKGAHTRDQGGFNSIYSSNKSFTIVPSLKVLWFSVSNGAPLARSLGLRGRLRIDVGVPPLGDEGIGNVYAAPIAGGCELV